MTKTNQSSKGYLRFLEQDELEATLGGWDPPPHNAKEPGLEGDEPGGCPKTHMSCQLASGNGRYWGQTSAGDICESDNESTTLGCMHCYCQNVS